MITRSFWAVRGNNIGKCCQAAHWRITVIHTHIIPQGSGFSRIIDNRIFCACDHPYCNILAKLDIISSYVDIIEKAAPTVVEEYSKRIHERVEEVLDGKDIDETRIIQEVAIFADRVAIDEELVRLRSHIDQFTKIIKETGNEPCGRKLDFLLQEINREINTTGSKCNNADIAKVVVDAKSEVEKIREQVQNIE